MKRVWWMIGYFGYICDGCVSDDGYRMREILRKRDRAHDLFNELLEEADE